MKSILKIISYIALACTIIPSILLYQDVISSSTNNVLMLIGTLVWFGTAPAWMNKNLEEG